MVGPHICLGWGSLSSLGAGVTDTQIVQCTVVQNVCVKYGHSGGTQGLIREEHRYFCIEESPTVKHLEGG